MPTTTNFGWTTPADTDLVKDGASAIRTLGTAIDTTVFNNASAGIAKTIVDAKGDIIAATASDTVARLAVGTNGQVLTADSTTATGLAYTTISAGAMTVLASGSLGSGTTTINSISQSYIDLVFCIYNYTNVSDDLALRFNNDSTANRYATVYTGTGGSSLSNTVTQTRMKLEIGYTDNASTNGIFVMQIPQYTFATGVRTVSWTSNTSDPRRSNLGAGSYQATGAISRIDVFPVSGTVSGGTYVLYGVK